MKKLLLIAAFLLVGCDGVILCKHPETGEIHELFVPKGPGGGPACNRGGFWLEPSKKERQEYVENKKIYICKHPKIEGRTFRIHSIKGKSCKDFFDDGGWEDATEE